RVIGIERHSTQRGKHGKRWRVRKTKGSVKRLQVFSDSRTAKGNNNDDRLTNPRIAGVQSGGQAVCIVYLLRAVAGYVNKRPAELVRGSRGRDKRQALNLCYLRDDV